jgi:hypothetical protein
MITAHFRHRRGIATWVAACDRGFALDDVEFAVDDVAKATGSGSVDVVELLPLGR